MDDGLELNQINVPVLVDALFFTIHNQNESNTMWEYVQDTWNGENHLCDSVTILVLSIQILYGILQLHNFLSILKTWALHANRENRLRWAKCSKWPKIWGMSQQSFLLNIEIKIHTLFWTPWDFHFQGQPLFITLHWMVYYIAKESHEDDGLKTTQCWSMESMIMQTCGQIKQMIATWACTTWLQCQANACNTKSWINQYIIINVEPIFLQYIYKLNQFQTNINVLCNMTWHQASVLHKHSFHAIQKDIQKM